MQDPTVTYGSYLAVDELLELQRPRSEGPEHDEMLFIVIHQVYELWFKQVLHEVDRVIVLLDARDAYRAQHSLKRILTILKVLVAQLDILETMTPLEFQSFRQRLEAASGFQSDQFRQLEFVLGNKSPAADRALSRRQPRARGAATTLRRGDAVGRVSQVPVARRLRDSGGAAVARRQRAHRAVARIAATLIDLYRRDPKHAEMCERLVDLDEGLQEWRYRHVKMVQRTIGAKIGTGGSSGAQYLVTTLDDADISGPVGDPIAGCEIRGTQDSEVQIFNCIGFSGLPLCPVAENQARSSTFFLCNSGTSIALLGVEVAAPPTPIGEGGPSPTGAAI